MSPTELRNIYGIAAVVFASILLIRCIFVPLLTKKWSIEMVEKGADENNFLVQELSHIRPFRYLYLVFSLCGAVVMLETYKIDGSFWLHVLYIALYVLSFVMLMFSRGLVVPYLVFGVIENVSFFFLLINVLPDCMDMFTKIVVGFIVFVGALVSIAVVHALRTEKEAGTGSSSSYSYASSYSHNDSSHSYKSSTSYDTQPTPEDCEEDDSTVGYESESISASSSSNEVFTDRSGSSSYEKKDKYIIGRDGCIVYEISGDYILDRSGSIVYEKRGEYLIDRSGSIVYQIRSDGDVLDRYGNYLGHIG